MTTLDLINARLQKVAQTVTIDCWLHGHVEVRTYGHDDPQCPQCDAIERARIAAEEAHQRALDNTNLRGRFRDATLDNYKADTPDQQAVLSACREFADNFDRDNGCNLWLIGTPGTGKTHLGSAIAMAVRAKYCLATKVMTCREIVRMVRATWQRDSEKTETQVIDGLGSLPLLVLDEVGVGFGTDSELISLYDVLDMRYQLRRPTVLISNLNAPAIKEFLGDRLYDRLREGAKVVPFKWDSHRASKAKAE
jgi:DNA replication protein DnaC